MPPNQIVDTATEKANERAASVKMVVVVMAVEQENEVDKMETENFTPRTVMNNYIILFFELKFCRWCLD